MSENFEGTLQVDGKVNGLTRRTDHGFRFNEDLVTGGDCTTTRDPFNPLELTNDDYAMYAGALPSIRGLNPNKFRDFAYETDQATLNDRSRSYIGDRSLAIFNAELGDNGAGGGRVIGCCNVSEIGAAEYISIILNDFVDPNP